MISLHVFDENRLTRDDFLGKVWALNNDQFDHQVIFSLNLFHF